MEPIAAMQLEEGQVCPVKMFGQRKCGRPFHEATNGPDKEPRCLMHSLDPTKNQEDYQQEFERVLKDAGEGWADFTGFVFPASNYTHRRFAASCCFNNTTFIQRADFHQAKFDQDAHFCRVTFRQYADFYSAQFARDALFGSSTFVEYADFASAAFAKISDFSSVSFGKNVRFIGSSFTHNAGFSFAAFTREVKFNFAKFGKNTNFSSTTLLQDCDFSSAVFNGDVRFWEIRFPAEATRGMSFANAKFMKPEEALFYQTDLQCALFHNCDVSKINFSAVQWRRRSRSGKWMVFDEVVPLDARVQGPPQSPLKPVAGDPNPRKYVLVAETYQQLKRNYDHKADYWTAGHFHYGEMEMKRLHSDSHRKWVRWLHSNLGLIAWYKYVSEYGESYAIPAMWLGVVLLLFALTYPASVLNCQSVAGSSPDKPIALSYSCPIKPGDDPSQLWRSRAKLIGHSFMTTLDIAAFQKEPFCKPSYPYGRLMEFLETLLVSTVGAVFLLAVRRQFRR
jgi:uncharacterized protein YjbI with pentapeptide repeats